VPEKEGAFLWLDRPYMSERSRMYFGQLGHDGILGWLKKQLAGWALSMNGLDPDSDRRDFVPEIYDERFELPNQATGRTGDAFGHGVVVCSCGLRSTRKSGCTETWKAGKAMAQAFQKFLKKVLWLGNRKWPIRWPIRNAVSRKTNEKRRFLVRECQPAASTQATLREIAKWLFYWKYAKTLSLFQSINYHSVPMNNTNESP